MNVRGIFPSLGAGGSLIAAVLCAAAVFGGALAFRAGGSGTAEANAGDVTVPSRTVRAQTSSSGLVGTVVSLATVGRQAARDTAARPRARARTRTRKRRTATTPRADTPTATPVATASATPTQSAPPVTDQVTGTAQRTVEQVRRVAQPVIDQVPRPAQQHADSVTETVDQVAGTVDAVAGGLLP
jgi:hypothetical protein